eukprot:15468820-Alexandrium_andersonii.AAC.1
MFRAPIFQDGTQCPDHPKLFERPERPERPKFSERLERHERGSRLRADMLEPVFACPCLRR